MRWVDQETGACRSAFMVMHVNNNLLIASLFAKYQCINKKSRINNCK